MIPPQRARNLLPAQMTPKTRTFCLSTVTGFRDRKLFSNDSGASYRQILALVKQLQSDAALNGKERIQPGLWKLGCKFCRSLPWSIYCLYVATPSDIIKCVKLSLARMVLQTIPKNPGSRRSALAPSYHFSLLSLAPFEDRQTRRPVSRYLPWLLPGSRTAQQLFQPWQRHRGSHLNESNCAQELFWCYPQPLSRAGSNLGSFAQSQPGIPVQTHLPVYLWELQL